MNEQMSIPVPIAIKELIVANNQLLESYQKELTSKIYSANEEMMRLLGLNPIDGWRLDLSTMMYVKQETPTENKD